MTVPNTTFQSTGAGNGVQTAFPFTWRVAEDDSVAVYIDRVKKTLGVDYTLVTNRLSTGLGGTVTFTAAPAGGTAILIQCEPDQLQEDDLRNNEAMPPSTVMKMVDKLTQLVQVALRSFQSADTTLVAGTLTTFPHGLGKIPTRTRAQLVCQVIDAGYAVGDVIDIATSSVGTIQADMTNLYLRTFSVLGTIAVANKGTFVSTNLTLASWKLRLLAS